MNQMTRTPLAGRGARLGAVALDALISAGSVTPGVVFITNSDTETGKGFGIALVVIAWVLVLIFQATFLIKRGQSLGKMVLGIRIVKASDESMPGFVKVFVLRMLVPTLLTCIPLVGVIVALADALFIFRDDRRCLHDFVAETKVIVSAFAVQPDSRHINEQVGGGASTGLTAATRIAHSHEATPTASAERSSNDAYVKALDEIEEGRLDKGTWARSFAESGGDESKAKALYIKARAKSIANEAVWVNTQPSITVSERAETVKTSRTFQSRDGLPKWAPALIAFAVVAGVVGYQQLNNRQTVTASLSQQPARQASQTNPFSDPDFGKTDELLDGVPKPVSSGEQRWNSYVEKVRGLQAAIVRGEIPLTDGFVSFDRSAYSGQWSMAETSALEGGQTWWRNESGDEFHIHVKNTTSNSLSVLGLEYSESDCGSNGEKIRFFVMPHEPIASGSQTVIQFRSDFQVSKRNHNCLVIFSAS